jgi:hypothetical protein
VQGTATQSVPGRQVGTLPIPKVMRGWMAALILDSRPWNPCPFLVSDRHSFQ